MLLMVGKLEQCVAPSRVENIQMKAIRWTSLVENEPIKDVSPVINRSNWKPWTLFTHLRSKIRPFKQRPRLAPIAEKKGNN